MRQNAVMTNIFSADTQNIIAKLAKNFPHWAATSPNARKNILLKWHDLILANKQDLAQIMHDECAKLMPECLAEIEYAASFVSWYANQAVVERDVEIEGGRVVYQPIGVVAAITPWNFPAAMITRKVAPALAAGCTVICKPSEFTPNSALALLKLAREAGLDEGVLEIIVGDAELIGKEFTDSHLIKKLSFTGSTAVGKLLIAQCAATVKKVTMELGGNAPFIVFADADLEMALEAAVRSRFRFSGQTCICANRFLVQAEIYDEFIARLKAKITQLQIAPLIHEKAAQKVEKLVEGAIAQGAKLVCGAAQGQGRYFPPTILVDVTADMKIFATEIFGPVATIIKFSDASEAIALANDTEYGLAAYVYGSDIVAQKVARAINFGMVGVNEIAIAAAHLPFGGMNQSGIGREGSHFGIEEYFEVKFIAKNR